MHVVLAWRPLSGGFTRLGQDTRDPLDRVVVWAFVRMEVRDERPELEWVPVDLVFGKWLAQSRAASFDEESSAAATAILLPQTVFCEYHVEVVRARWRLAAGGTAHELLDAPWREHLRGRVPG